MKVQSGRLDLGAIICKHCGELIDTLDTKRVITYFANCNQPHCSEHQHSHDIVDGAQSAASSAFSQYDV